MRGKSNPEFSGRCPHCRILQAHCICAHIPTVATQTRIIIIRHGREVPKPSGTARIALLALPNAEIVEYGQFGEAANDTAVTQLGDLDSASLLFPGQDKSVWPTSPIKKLIVLDGTWRQARRMRRRMPALWPLPTLDLAQPAVHQVRLRTPTSPEGRSTLEAIAEALGILEGPDLATQLHALHNRFIEAVLRSRGLWDIRQAALGPP